MSSPYEGLLLDKWYTKTKELIEAHPLNKEDIIDAVLESWSGIMSTKIANELQIGKDIFPSPQILGNYLHELIPVMLERKYPTQYKRESIKTDKDLVFIPDDYFSVEIKTSSSPNSIYGNRSYGQPSNGEGKSKDGYYIGVNFEKFSIDCLKPQIKKIRFGWLDHSDWVAQKAASGQQASIPAKTRESKLILIYNK